MSMKKLLCLVLALILCGAMAFAETDGLQSQLDAANARIAELEAQVELYKPFYDAQIIIEFDGGAIFYDDVIEEYNYTAEMYASYGITLSEYGYEEYFKQEAADMLFSIAVVQAKAHELGLDQLDDETHANLVAQAEEYFESYIESVASMFEGEGVSAEEVRAQSIEYLYSMGYTLEDIVDDLIAGYIDEQMYNYVVSDIAVTEEEVVALYESHIAEDQSNYVTDSAYASSRNNGATIYWNPEGYRAVKHVLIKFDSEQSARRSELKATLTSLEAELATAEDAAAVQAEIDSVNSELEALYAELMPVAEEVIAKFNAGADFMDLMDEYGEDPGMMYEPGRTNGYAISEASITSNAWDVPFAVGAMTIEEIGGISEPVFGANGIHIIYYESDVPAGAVALESVYALLEETILNEKISTTYTALVEEWGAALNPVYHYDRLA